MKLRTKAFIIAWLLFATAFANKTLGQVVMLRPHETIANKQDTLGAIKVFLAGTIDMGNSVDWQTLIAKRFENGCFLTHAKSIGTRQGLAKWIIRLIGNWSILKPPT